MRLARFDLSERVLHWFHAIFFIWLLITGIQLFLTPKSLLGDPPIKMMHLYASIPFIMIPPIVYRFGSSYMHEDIRELMSLKSNDIQWFLKIFKNRRVDSSKFNPGQMVNFFVTLLLIIGLTISGIVVWMKSRFSVDFVELNFMVHDFLAELSMLLFSGHILLSIYHSESIRGIVFGKVDEGWAKEHYPEWWKRAG